MAKRPRFSRWRRLPGVYRIGDRKPPDVGQDLQRLTLYLPWRILDWAEAQALRMGFATAQQYCEDLVRREVEAERDRERLEEAEARRGPLEGLAAVSDDPDFLAELSASAASRRRIGPRGARPEMNPNDTGATPAPDGPGLPIPSDRPTTPEERQAIAVVLRHAGLAGDDPSALLPTLRRGEPIGADAAQELLAALRDLEVAYRGESSIDRKLAYALHRLAFEGQILLTEGWHGAGADPRTIDVMRIIQEAVDRVLSGEDIRYFAPGPGPEVAP